MEIPKIEIKKELIIIGGGMPGICAALQAARLGIAVVLVHDETFFGGNVSPIKNVPTTGAMRGDDFNFFSREGGIFEEIFIKNLYINPNNNPYRRDALLWDLFDKEKNLDIIIDTYIDKVKLANNGSIQWVSGTQRGGEKRYIFKGNLFLDNTGDGTVGYLAEADYRMGRESKDVFNEVLAQKKEDKMVLPSTLSWYAEDTGSSVQYIPPDFALDLQETDVLKKRNISESSFDRYQWFYDLDGHYHQTRDYQKIIRDHQAFVYGLWSYIKNNEKFNSENYDLKYVASKPGKRESRRLVGDYILTENEIVNQKEFKDAVGHGGFPIDPHPPEGFFSEEPPAKCYYLKGIYQIPLRSGYSRNVKNLMMAGRCMSASHVALNSLRVVQTLSTLGQALGVAAYICRKYQIKPGDIFDRYIEELQQLLLKEGQYVVGVPNKDSEDKALKSKNIKSSSCRKFEITNLTDNYKLYKKTVLILPVKNKINNISLLIMNKKTTFLKYKIYLDKKKYSYYPENLIKEDEKKINSSGKFRWVDLPLNVNIDNNYIYVELEKNEDINLGMSDERLVGITTIIFEKNNPKYHFEYDGMERRKNIPRRWENNLCFKVFPQTQMYPSKNIINGYSRPYGLPNAWMSQAGNKSEWIELSFDSIQKIKKIILYFDAEFNSLFKTYQESNLKKIPSIIKDYTILYLDEDNDYQKLKSVKNNYLRINTINLDKKVKAKSIKIVLEETNGSLTKNLFEVRLY